jgi:hypothetical protein
MNHHRDEKDGRVRGSSLFSHVGKRHRDNEKLDDETLAEGPYVDRVADFVRSLDPIPADRTTNPDAQQVDAEAAEQAEAEGAEDESATSALAVIEPATIQDEGGSTAQVVDDADAPGVDSAARVLALAQKLHDEYVAEGQNTRERLISEGQTKYDELVSAGKGEQEALIAEADVLVVEAQQKRAEVLQGLGSERSLLQKEIEELRSFERDYRAHLKAYLAGRLTDLEQAGTDESSSHHSQEESQVDP